MIDIVNGLRRIAEEGYRFAGDAADEIERLRASLEAAEKELAELRSSMKFRTSLIGRTEAERDALQAKIAEMEKQAEMTHNEYPTRLDICDGKYTLIIDMDTGRAECLRYGEKWRDLVGDKMVLALFDELVEARARAEAAKAETESLCAKIEAMEQQEPARLVTPTAYRWRYRGAVMWQYGELTEETARRAKEHNHEVQPLYALPGAKGEEK